MYSKGLILASAIRQVRGLGDNKFEVITSLRTFIFRAEGEGTSAAPFFFFVFFFLVSLSSSWILNLNPSWPFSCISHHSPACFMFEHIHFFSLHLELLCLYYLESFWNLPQDKKFWDIWVDLLCFKVLMKRSISISCVQQVPQQRTTAAQRFHRNTVDTNGFYVLM